MKQREMFLPGEIKKPALLDVALIRRCQSEQDALRLVWDQRRVQGMTLTSAAERLGIAKNVLSAALDLEGHIERAASLNQRKKKKYLPTNLYGEFQRLCGNLAFDQYRALAEGNILKQETAEEKIARLEQELERTRQMAA